MVDISKNVKPGMLDNQVLIFGDDVRQMGIRCRECNSPLTVYFIAKPMGELFPEGAYCYPCLLKKCRLTRCIPFPISVELCDKLKLDMGLKVSTPPKRRF